MIRLITCAAVALATLACTESEPVGAPSGSPETATVAAAPSVASVDGNWVWEHQTVFVIPTPVAAAVLPAVAQPHLSGPITKVQCHVTGTMNLTQVGADFSGSATQTSSCRLKEGPAFGWPFVFQPDFVVVDGRVEGRSIRFAVPPACQNRGSVRLSAGIVTGWMATGSCEIPIPNRPAVAKTIIWEATRLQG